MSERLRAVYIKDGEWWVAWTEEVGGAITQGETIEEARENLMDALAEMRKPLVMGDISEREVVVEDLEI